MDSGRQTASGALLGRSSASDSLAPVSTLFRLQSRWFLHTVKPRDTQRAGLMPGGRIEAFSFIETQMINLLVATGLPTATRILAVVGALMVIVPGRVPHADLKSSIPKEKSTVAEPPKELRLTFTEPPELALTHIVLRAPAGDTVVLGKLSVARNDKATIVAPVTGPVAAGTYTVEWEITGEDGHPVDGKFGFTVTGAPLTRPAMPTETADAPNVTRPAPDSAGRRPDTAMMQHDAMTMPSVRGRFNAESPGYVIVRFAFYMALLIVVGATAFRGVVLRLIGRRPEADGVLISESARRAASIGWAAAWVLLAAVVARLVAQALAVNGRDAIADSSRLRAIVLSTMWGKAWIVQLLATFATLYGFGSVKRADASSSRSVNGWSVATLAALLLAFTPAFAGHAAAVKVAWPIPELLDGLHIVGAAGWVGSLLLVLAAGVPAALSLAEERRGGAVAELVNAFSPTALVFAGLAGLTGLVAAWLHVGTFTALWNEQYGKLLLAKLAVLSIVALTGAYNWLRVKPSLATVEGAHRLRRSATVEVSVAVIVLLITAILVATPTPMGRM